MAIGFIHGIIFILEDLITWKLGKEGFPFWTVLVIGFLIAFFFWGHLVRGAKFIYDIIKKLLSFIGIKI